MNRDWLIEIKRQIHRDKEFYSQMDEQLSSSFEKATAEPMQDFVLIPPFGKEFEVMEEPECTYLDADLLNIDIVFSVSIAWKHGEDGYSFWWRTLPLLEIESALRSRRDIQFDVDFAFAIAIKNLVWPNVKLTFYTESEFHPDTVAEKIYNLIEQWNENRNGGVVHNAGKLTQVDENIFSMAIDFGSTGRDFLTYLLKELEEFEIIQVTLDSGI